MSNVKVAINGFGRIGRVALRIAISQPDTFKLCGINVRNADLDYMKYMVRYDSTFGRFQGELDTYEQGLIINGQKIPPGRYIILEETDAIKVGDLEVHVNTKNEALPEVAEVAEELGPADTAESEEEEETEDLEAKFVSKPNEITLEHIDFVQLRLRHIARSTSDNITELRELQQKVFNIL